MKDYISRLFSVPDQSFYADFSKEVLFGDLMEYQEIIQGGIRTGQTYYEHVLSGCCTIHRLTEVCKLTEEEEKVLLSSFAIHDLNKIPSFQGKSLKNLATLDIIEAELKKVGINKVFPQYKDYLYDIKFLILGHSGHYHSATEGIIPNYDPYEMDKDRLKELIQVMKAVDVADLSNSFEEGKMKKEFLMRLNEMTKKEYYLTWHRTAENRGMLTNIIHNGVMEYLEKNHGYLPLLLYPEGTYYLVSREQKLEEKDYDQISETIISRIGTILKGCFEEFITPTPSGIKIDEKCIQLGLSFEKIYSYSIKLIDKKKNSQGHQEKIRDQWVKAYEDLPLDLKKKMNDHREEIVLKPYYDEEFYVGELLKTYYNFLKTHTRLKVEEAWERIYKLFHVSLNEQEIFQPLSPLYYRPYAVGRFISQYRGVDYEKARDLVKEDWKNEMKQLDKGSSNHEMEEYLKRTLLLQDFNKMDKDYFKQDLLHYIENPFKQCSTCSLDLTIKDWMSADVPANVKVQYFSNRLQGGSREPKRNICRICNTQFAVEKVNFISYSNTTTYYLHFYPHSFLSPEILNSFKIMMRKLQELDVTAMLINSDDYIINHLKGMEKHAVRITGVKANGFPVPKYSEIIGNLIILPLNCPGENDTQKFIFALFNALIMMNYFKFRCVVTQSPVPLLGNKDFDVIFLDNLPSSLMGFIGNNNQEQQDIDRLWVRLMTLYAICSQVDKGTDRWKVYAELMRHASSNTGYLFVVLDRLIEKKVANSKEANFLTKKIMPDLLTLIREEDVKLNRIEALGRLGWEAKLKGKSLERTSLLKPFDLLFELLEKRGTKARFQHDVLFAGAVEEIMAYLERTTDKEYSPGRTKREKIKQYVDLFRELLEEDYEGKINELLADQRILKSAYLFYVRESITKKEEGN